MRRLLSGEIAEPWELKHLSLKRLDHQNQPDHNSGKAYHHRDQQYQQGAKDRDNEEDNAGEFESDRRQNFRAAQQEGLDGVEAHKTVFFIRLDEQEDNRRDEGDICQHARNVFGKNTDGAMRARFGLPGAAASGTEPSGIGHLGGTVRAGYQRDIRRQVGRSVRRIHCRDHIKTRSGQQMGGINLTH